MNGEISILVRGLRLFARHGVMPQERVVGNEFVVDVELLYPAADAVEHDRLEATVNYAEVVEVVKAQMAVPSQLIEHVAGRIAGALRLRWPLLKGGRVKVSKPAPPIPGVTLDEVAVELRF